MTRFSLLFVLLFGLFSCTEDKTDTSDHSRNDGGTDSGAESDADTNSDTNSDADGGAEVSEEWGKTCSDDIDCGAPTDYCVKEPGLSTGYCTIKCSSNSVCYDAGASEDTWSCNAVFDCLTPDTTWCGPMTEVEDGGGVIMECE